GRRPIELHRRRQDDRGRFAVYGPRGERRDQDVYGNARVTLLQLDDVEARYGPVRALHGISLRVGEGELVAVLGANGAGKTTTLRAVSGTVRRSGDVFFNGSKLPRRVDATARAGIAHVPEGRGTFSELSVWE